MSRCAIRGNEVVLFHVLDPEDVQPKLNGPSILVDMETNPNLKSHPTTARRSIAKKSTRTLRICGIAPRAAGMGYFLLMTDRPLDEALREYLTLRGGRK